MARPRLTDEDVAWLEQRIRAAIDPVAPRPGFVRDAKVELLRQASLAESEASRPSWVVAAYWVAGVAAVLLVVVALKRRRAT